VITCEEAGFKLVLQLLGCNFELVIFWRSEVDREITGYFVEQLLYELFKLTFLDRLGVLLAEVEKDEMEQIIHDEQIPWVTFALNSRQNTRNIETRIQFLHQIAPIQRDHLVDLVYSAPGFVVVLRNMQIG